MTERDLATVLLGESASMRALRESILKIALSPLSVLVQGPTGVGKELVAQALHRASRRSGRFVSLNVSGIQESMFADAMFGHRRGAFTNAVTSTPGYIGEAEHGTLFLDEIGSLPLVNQATLLRVLETHTYRQLGATADQQCDFRVVTATNVRLPELVQHGAFRRDLMYRLQGVMITVPTLRERRGDIPHLAQHFAVQFGTGWDNAQFDDVRFTDAALQFLQDYAWPGNVRQLKHVVEAAVCMIETPLIDTHIVRAALRDDDLSSPPGQPRMRRAELRALLEQHAGDVKQIATHYGRTVGTIYRWLREYQIPTWERQRRRSSHEDEHSFSAS